ncbi:GNAT family N-acetyltransferase [Amycolatopsis viridis]|uniref:GNAT superfamily N-acetyltransferase n=1 Tax=Amycolatopsis viridis TaxID=185678 RepID=A0ABX0SNS6_9PSEU|nr:GNAT family N-acetyltransferase [Amycolatopsis viridis]NIH78193.1 GNAT superfamily N-acetyltransferase [Amycolatopsis viridis]
MRIGKPYNWPKSRWSGDEWAGYLAREGRQCVLIRYLSEVAGLADFQSHGDGEVEITTFGVVPEYVGKGIGAYALTLVVERAWHAAPDIRRIWLHTSDLDHPHALPNYHRRASARTARPTDSADRETTDVPGFPPDARRTRWCCSAFRCEERAAGVPGLRGRWAAPAGDLGCGAITAAIVQHDEHVIWRDFAGRTRSVSSSNATRTSARSGSAPTSTGLPSSRCAAVRTGSTGTG